MELLDRYLQAVKKHLPWQRQDDILAELRANLESQLEDQQEEIGRPLTTAEVETWLKQIGPPIQMAARYQPQQYLIGPSVFPTYWYVLQLALFWVVAIYLVAKAVQIFASETPNWTAALRAVLQAPAVLIMTAAWVTLVFAVLEFVTTRYPSKWPEVTEHFTNWSPSGLPPLQKDFSSGKKPRNYAMAAAEVSFGFIFLGWLLLVPKNPILLFGPGAQYMQISPFQIEPVWYTFYWWAVALNVLQLGWRCVDLLAGTWQGPRIAQQIVTKLLGLIPLVVLITAPGHLLIVLKHPETDQARFGGTLDSINVGIHRGLFVVCAIVVAQLLWEIWQVYSADYRKRVSAMR